MSEKVGVSQNNPDPFPARAINRPGEYVHLYERPEPETKPEPESKPEPEEELAGEDAEELIILEMPDILQTMAVVSNERKGDYGPLSPSWGVFELLATMLQLTVVTAVEAANIVRMERDRNVD